MTDCILEAINSSRQAFISALTGRLCPSIIRPSDDGSECYFLDNRSGAAICAFVIT